ncbi:MAG: hypothetical protein JSS54_00485 [Proteobacteria bacterium]|nr:hypothetical protein [Pseudomonadota bacterium]MBS0267434.1 hypothetical protein [Pseudomonadota bacterium]
MSISLLSEIILTLAGPAFLVGGVWALAAWALNESEAQMQWPHLLSAPEKSSVARQPGVDRQTQDDISKLEEL